MRSLIINKKRASAVDHQSNAQLLEMQHFAELGRLSASLLHEISNPLTATLIYLEQTDDKSSASVRKALRNVQLLRRYVEAARQQVSHESQLSYFSVNRQISQLKNIVLPLARQSGIKLIIEATPNCKIYGDSVKFQQVLANLIVNAIEAYSNDRAPYLDKPVRVSFVCSKKALTIRVVDWGQGIGPSQIANIFEPFYTTKRQTGHGLGIGLAIVKQYVTQDFHGVISVRSSARLGTVFTIKLPKA